MTALQRFVVLAGALPLALAALPPGSAPARAASPCRAWPGEMPAGSSTASPDALVSGWASARTASLLRLAGELEAHDAVEAWRLRAHASCLDPDLARPPAPTPVHRPAMHEVGIPATAQPSPRLATSFALLGEPVALRTREPLDPPPLRFDFASVDERLAAGQRALDEARFRAAALDAAWVRAKLLVLDAQERVQMRRARVEVLAATAQLALGQAVDARASLERALDANPYLVLDPQVAAPKVLRLLEAIRRERSEARP